MILPPITVYASNLSNVREALIDYLKGDYISTMNVDEQCVHFTFHNIQPTPHLVNIVHDLSLGIDFTYNNHTYKIHTQYFDI